MEEEVFIVAFDHSVNPLAHRKYADRDKDKGSTNIETDKKNGLKETNNGIVHPSDYISFSKHNGQAHCSFRTSCR